MSNYGAAFEVAVDSEYVCWINTNHLLRCKYYSNEVEINIPDALQNYSINKVSSYNNLVCVIKSKSEDK